MRSLKQFNSQRLFELFDGRADRGLLDIQFLRGKRKRLPTRGSLKNNDMAGRRKVRPEVLHNLKLSKRSKFSTVTGSLMADRLNEVW